MAHSATDQVTKEAIAMLYYDDALGAGNGALPAARSVSSFVFEPSWQSRPMPPRDKYAGTVRDKEWGSWPDYRFEACRQSLGQVAASTGFRPPRDRKPSLQFFIAAPSKQTFLSLFLTLPSGV
jgi:hypothetical protein